MEGKNERNAHWDPVCFASWNWNERRLHFPVTVPRSCSHTLLQCHFNPPHLPTSQLIPSSSRRLFTAYFNIPLQSIKLHNSTAVRRSKRRCCKTTGEWGKPCNDASPLFSCIATLFSKKEILAHLHVWRTATYREVERDWSHKELKAQRTNLDLKSGCAGLGILVTVPLQYSFCGGSTKLQNHCVHCNRTGKLKKKSGSTDRFI